MNETSQEVKSITFCDRLITIPTNFIKQVLIALSAAFTWVLALQMNQLLQVYINDSQGSRWLWIFITLVIVVLLTFITELYRDKITDFIPRVSKGICCIGQPILPEEQQPITKTRVVLY